MFRTISSNKEKVQRQGHPTVGNAINKLVCNKHVGNNRIPSLTDVDFDETLDSFKQKVRFLFLYGWLLLVLYLKC